MIIELLKLKKILNSIFLNECLLFFIKIIKTGNKKKKMKGSHIRQRIGNIKNTYIKGIFIEYLLFDKFKNIIKPTYKKTSFLAKTSSSAIGYKIKIGENIAKTVKIFLGVSFIKK